MFDDGIFAVGGLKILAFGPAPPIRLASTGVDVVIPAFTILGSTAGVAALNKLVIPLNASPCPTPPSTPSAPPK